MFRGEHINFLARLTLGQPAGCPRATRTPTRAKSLCFMCLFSPEFSPLKDVLVGKKSAHCFLASSLSDPTEIPPPPLSRDKCSNTPVALCFQRYRRLSLLHPHFFHKNGLSQSKDRPHKGGIADKACLWSLSRYRGASHEIVSPIALQWDTEHKVFLRPQVCKPKSLDIRP